MTKDEAKVLAATDRAHLMTPPTYTFHGAFQMADGAFRLLWADDQGRAMIAEERSRNPFGSSFWQAVTIVDPATVFASDAPADPPPVADAPRVGTWVHQQLDGSWC